MVFDFYFDGVTVKNGNSKPDLTTLAFSSKFCGRNMELSDEKAIRTQIGPMRVSTMAYKGHAANIKETTQIKKKPRKQKRKHANKKETTQTKKKPRK